MVKWLLWIVALAFAFAPSASAQDGSNCTVDSHYSPGTRNICIQLADARETGGTTAASAVFDTEPATASGKSLLLFAYGKCPTDCEPGTVRLYESDSSVAGSPNVWHEIGSINGCGSGFVSEYEPLRTSKRFVKAAWDANISDAQCTTDSVDVTLTFLPGR